MNVAVRHAPGPSIAAAPIRGRIARVEIFHEFAAAEPSWRALERANAVGTPYQRYDFLLLWQRHIGAAAGVTPFIVVGFDSAGSPLLLWPFGRRNVGGLRVLEFLGGKHANFNVALWCRDLAAGITKSEIQDILSRLAGQADALMLINQSLTWRGTSNPFALLPYQVSPNMGYSGALAPDFDALLHARTNAAARKKMRKKERTLAGFGAVRFERASNPADTRRVLDAFFKQKSARMQSQGVPDVFAAPGVRRFIETAATESTSNAHPVLELYALSVDDIVAATLGGIVGGGRFCAMFNSIIPDRFGAESPGEQLIVNLVRACCQRGLSTFDLGIGEARYKNLLCDEAEPLFDSFLALTPAGRLFTVAARAHSTIKRLIKRSPALWSVVRAARRLRAWRASA
jgi:CelD/BcsL family acetyltransferase involved in cellulose biosynthesis